MARLARVVVPGVPHHVTQRGNRGQETFFGEADYAAYLSLLSEWCGRCGVAVWAYCLMPNHVHLIVVPRRADGLRRALGEAHRRYTRRINFLVPGFPTRTPHYHCARYPVRRKGPRLPILRRTEPGAGEMLAVNDLLHQIEGQVEIVVRGLEADAGVVSRQFE